MRLRRLEALRWRSPQVRRGRLAARARCAFWFGGLRSVLPGRLPWHLDARYRHGRRHERDRALRALSVEGSDAVQALHPWHGLGARNPAQGGESRSSARAAASQRGLCFRLLARRELTCSARVAQWDLAALEPESFEVVASLRRDIDLVIALDADRWGRGRRVCGSQPRRAPPWPSCRSASTSFVGIPRGESTCPKSLRRLMSPSSKRWFFLECHVRNERALMRGRG